MSLGAPLAAVASRATNVARSAGISVALYAGVGLVACVGVGFLIAAAYMAIADATSPLIAALILGVAFLLVAGLVLAVVISRQRHKKTRARETAANTALIASSLSLATTGLRLVSGGRGRLLLPAIAAMAAAYYFGRSGDDAED